MSDMLEISKSEYDVLVKARGLLDTLWNDPKEGLEFKRKVKNVLPSARIPELDILETATKPLNDRLSASEESSKKLEERLEKFESERRDEKEETELVRSLESAKKKFSLTEDGMSKAVARMREMKNPDAESAAAWVAAQEKKAAPVAKSNYAPQSLNLYGAGKEDDMWADLNKDPIGYFDKKTAEILNEFADAA